MSFIEDYPVADLKPAPYNPRLIDQPSFDRLKRSIERFGVVKPLIINGDGTIVAGHQRARALRSLGIEKAPVYPLPLVSLHDEIRFNQFHNSVETSATPVNVTCSLPAAGGWTWITPDYLEVGPRQNTVVVAEIARLIARYGDWGSIIVDKTGRAILNSDYAVAARQMGYNVLAWVVPYEEDSRPLAECLAQEYGEYSYGLLDVKPFNQVACQRPRVKGKQSTLYERLVKPCVQPGMTLIDFGAGRGEAVADLCAQGHWAFAYEPYISAGPGSKALDVWATVQQIDALEKQIEDHGLADVVVLDSVINSTVSVGAHHHVLTTCNALMGPDAVFFTSTRSQGENERRARFTKVSNTHKRYMEFLDRDGYSASFMNGHWSLQRFMTADQLEADLAQYFEAVKVIPGPTQLWASCRGPRQLPMDQYENSLCVEFDMEYPGGLRHGLARPLVDAILKRLETR